MQKLRAIVNIDEVVITGLDVDRKVLFFDPLSIRNCAIRRIVRFKERRVPPGPY